MCRWFQVVHRGQRIDLSIKIVWQTLRHEKKARPYWPFWTMFTKTWSFGIPVAAGRSGLCDKMRRAGNQNLHRQARLSGATGSAVERRAQPGFLRPARPRRFHAGQIAARREGAFARRANFSSRASSSPSSVTAAGSPFPPDSERQTRHRFARHQGRPRKRRRHLGGRTGGRGRQPDFQPHAARPGRVRRGDGKISGRNVQ